jgi:hypothetical protein
VGRRVLAACALLALAARAGAPAEDLEVPSGASRPGDLVSLGRPVAIRGEIDGSVVVVGGHVDLEGRVRRNLILLGADAALRGKARVDGDLLVVGGRVAFETGATPEGSVGGRVRSVAALEAAYLAELRTSPLKSAAVSPLLLSFRLLVLLGWLIAGMALLRLAPRRLTRAAAAAPGHLGFLGVLGAAAVLTGALLCAFVLTVLPAAGAFAVGGAVVVLLLVAKAFGLSVLFLLLGRRLARSARRDTAFFGDPAALSIGLVALGVVSLAPVAGAVVWSVASLVAVGLALQGLLLGRDALRAPDRAVSGAA